MRHEPCVQFRMCGCIRVFISRKNPITGLDDAFAYPLRETLSKFYFVAPEFKQGRLQLYNTMILVGGSTSTLYSSMGKIQGEARYLQSVHGFRLHVLVA
jgi:hypothetical protein